MDKIKIAVFASGNGSNAENICKYFAASGTAEVSLILCNNPGAYVLHRAENLNVPAVVFDGKQLEDGTVLSLLRDNGIGFVVLAGFLKKIPDAIVYEYENRIVNIHPSLLPKYGGKGMYGDRVHEAVFAAKEKQSGITIHYLNERYDEGNIIFQKTCDIVGNDTPATIAAKVHALEYECYPQVIDAVISRLKDNNARNK